jgi:RNA polymerase sigma-70 factor, ECF subfamily
MDERAPAAAHRDPHGETSRHLRGAIAGDLEALDQLVARVTPLLLQAANYRLRALAGAGCEPMDLVQDVWLRTLPHLGELQPRDGRLVPVLLAWLGTTLRRRARDLLEVALRRQAAMPLGGGDDVLPDVPAATRGVVTRVLANEDHGIVGAAIGELPETDREIVLLRGIEQVPIGEVATLLGITAGAVKMRYHRALQALRERVPRSIFAELDDE